MESTPRGWLLPNVLVSVAVRPAIAISRTLTTCGVRGWIIALHRIGTRSSFEHHVYCDIELLNDSSPPSGFQWCHQRELVHRPSLLAVQHAIINSRSNDLSPASSFSRSSFVTTTTWLVEALGRRGTRWTGGYQQYRIAGDITLASFDTTEGVVYLKSGMQARFLEATLGNALWNAVGGFVAEPIAGDAAAGRWLTAAAPGTHLSPTDRNGAVLVAGKLAEMQNVLARRCFDLRALGVPVLTLQDLFRSATVLLDICRWCCGVTERRLTSMVDMLRRSCASAESSLGHAVTLVHPDVAPSNVIIDGNTVRFLDFQGAFLGCPLISLGVFLSALSGHVPSSGVRHDEPFLHTVASAYLQRASQWFKIVTPAITETARLAALLGCATHWHVKLLHFRAGQSMAGPLASPYQLAGVALSTFERMERLTLSPAPSSHGADRTPAA